MDIRNLLNQIADQETQLRSLQFLAPCVPGGLIRTRITGLVYTFLPKPRDFAGWGIFQPVDEKIAAVVEAASLPQVEAYLQQFKSFRLRLAYPLQNQTWLAYPANEADMQQRLGKIRPVPVHLVTEGTNFEQIVARWDGQSWWFAELDRRDDPAGVEALQNALKQLIPIASLQFKNLTPEMRSVYRLVAQQTEGFSQAQQDEKRLQQALQLGGGTLRQFQDRQDYWMIEWTTVNGEMHTSAIAKSDLTVISSGICLSGRDRDFDLQSLVGVLENQ